MRYQAYEAMQQLADLFWDFAKFCTRASEWLHEKSKEVLNG
jgi:hypothetical protein